MIDAVYTLDVTAFRLNFQSLQFDGPDAADFLQRQLMNDVRQLREDGSAQWTGLLSAKGKVQHLFLLLRVSAQRYVAVCPDRDCAPLSARLQERVFRSKVKMTQETHAEVWHLPASSTDAAPDAKLLWQGDRWLSWFAEPPAGLAPPCPDDALTALQQSWDLADIEGGVVRLHDSIREEFTPQMLGLERRKAFSLSKGCFPGQEILARTHFLGKAKRTLRLLAVEGEVACGASIFHHDREVGRVVSDAVSNRALAVLPLEQPEPLANPTAAFTYLSPTWSAG